jgi:hypothetical protein
MLLPDNRNPIAYDDNDWVDWTVPRSHRRTGARVRSGRECCTSIRLRANSDLHHARCVRVACSAVLLERAVAFA